MVGNTKAESLKHFIIKCMIYKRIKELGHKGNCEYDTEGPSGIFDVVDWDSGLVYEIWGNKPSKGAVNVKLMKYLKHGGIRDVIFVNAYTFSSRASVNRWYEKIKEMII